MRTFSGEYNQMSLNSLAIETDHLVRDEGVGGSNPLTPTNILKNSGCFDAPVVTQMATAMRAIQRALQQKLQTQHLNAKLIPSASTKRAKNARFA